jgi:hypothetical protein
MAIRRSDPVVANLEAIRSTDGRFEQRFIYESPIITIEPNGDDQVLQTRPPAFVEVEAEVSRIVAQGETNCADEPSGIKIERHVHGRLLCGVGSKGSSLQMSW